MKQTCAFLRSSRQAQRGSFDLSPVCLHFNLRSLHFMLAPATRTEVTLKSYTHGTYKFYGFCRSVLTCFFLGVITYMQPQSSPLTKMKTRLSEPTVIQQSPINPLCLARGAMQETSTNLVHKLKEIQYLIFLDLRNFQIYI